MAITSVLYNESLRRRCVTKKGNGAQVEFYDNRYLVMLTLRTWSIPFDLGCCVVGWFLNVLVNYKVISRTGPKTERLTILRAATHETALGDYDFCLSRSHYTDTDPTSSERAATAGIKPGTSLLSWHNIRFQGFSGPKGKYESSGLMEFQDQLDTLFIPLI